MRAINAILLERYWVAGSYGTASIQNVSDDELVTVESVTLCTVDEHTLE